MTPCLRNLLVPTGTIIHHFDLSLGLPTEVSGVNITEKRYRRDTEYLLMFIVILFVFVSRDVVLDENPLRKKYAINEKVPPVYELGFLVHGIIPCGTRLMLFSRNLLSRSRRSLGSTRDGVVPRSEEDRLVDPYFL